MRTTEPVKRATSYLVFFQNNKYNKEFCQLFHMAYTSDCLFKSFHNINRFVLHYYNDCPLSKKSKRKIATKTIISAWLGIIAFGQNARFHHIKDLFLIMQILQPLWMKCLINSLNWTDKQIKALKNWNELMSETILCLTDYSKTFYLQTCASANGSVSILLQYFDETKCQLHMEAADFWTAFSAFPHFRISYY